MTEPIRDVGERLEEIVAGMGARVTDSPAAGSVRFTLEDVPGLARIAEGAVRASFFLAFDPEPADAEDFLSSHAVLPLGTVETVDIAHGRALRFFAVLELGDSAADTHAAREEETTWPARVAEVARALDSAWQQGYIGGSDYIETLVDAGVAVPPRGVALAIRNLGVSAEGGPVAVDPFTYGPWHWGSTYLDPRELEIFDPSAIARRLVEQGPLFALVRAERPGSSPVLTTITCTASIAFFFQNPLAGEGVSPTEALIGVNTVSSRLHVFFENAARADEGTTEQGRPLRWLAAHSALSGATGIVDLDAVRAGTPFDAAWHDVDGVAHLFQQAAELLAAENR